MTPFPVESEGEDRSRWSPGGGV